MAQPTITEGARAAWATLNDRDFYAVLDMVDELVASAEASDWPARSAAAVFTDGPWGYVAVTRGRVVGVVEHVAGWQLISVGVPS